jgi:signal transduction histidine kinase
VQGGQRGGGLWRALLIALTLALVVPGALAGLVLIYLNLQRTLEVDTQVKAEKLVELLQAGLTPPLWQIDLPAAKPLLDAVATDPSVVAITVRDHVGAVMLELKPNPDDPADAIVISHQIAKEDEILGEVTLTYATLAARGEARRASLLLLAVILTQLLVSLGLIGAWLARRVLNPLEILRASAVKISAGDLKSGVPALPQDEFGELATKLDFMRQSLAQSVTQLEARVAERTRELQDVNATLQTTLENLRLTQKSLVQSEKLASLGSLVAGIAHELNTPIGNGITVVSTISGRCIELRQQIDGGMRRSQLESFLADVEGASTLAQASLEKAARLVRDFKQVAVDQTSSRRRKFDLAETTREMLAAVMPRHKHVPVRIELQIPPGILLDSYPGALEQVITNLVENAIVHGFDGRTAAVIEIAARAADEWVVLSVRDDGKGIAAEHLDKIFDPFFTTRLGEGGSGLGLSIAYGLVTGMLGGRIAVTSTVGQGTTFNLELPLVAPRSAEPGAGPTSQAPP